MDYGVIFLVCSIAIIALSVIIFHLLKRNKELNLRLERRDKISLQNQRSVLKGNISQQWAPILPDFPVSCASDVFHFGGGVVDFIAFEGISNGNIKKIWFIDSKYNKSKLNNSQKQIKMIIDELYKLKPDLIEFQEYNPKKGAEDAFREKGIDVNLD